MTGVPCRWDGRALVPLRADLARAELVAGEIYIAVPPGGRSQASHNHYFAAVAEAWRNLPDAAAANMPTPEHLRKFALIKAGYRDIRSIVCASRAEALRLAAFIRPMDEYAVVTVSGAAVSVATAQSQSIRAMGKAEFEASKAAVLDVVAEMIGITVDDLSQNASA